MKTRERREEKTHEEIKKTPLFSRRPPKTSPFFALPSQPVHRRGRSGEEGPTRGDRGSNAGFGRERERRAKKKVKLSLDVRRRRLFFRPFLSPHHASRPQCQTAASTLPLPLPIHDRGSALRHRVATNRARSGECGRRVCCFFSIVCQKIVKVRRKKHTRRGKGKEGKKRTPHLSSSLKKNNNSYLTPHVPPPSIRRRRGRGIPRPLRQILATQAPRAFRARYPAATKL